MVKQVKTKINTGFEHNPYHGALASTALLSRYLEMDRFKLFLENKGFWFSRVYRWKEGDPCESTLLPAFKKHTLDVHNGSLEGLNYMLAHLEFNLKSAFGCCFTEYSGTEYDNMWRLYAPKPEYGVMVVVEANAIKKALDLAIDRGESSYSRFAKVEYMTDGKANQMKVRHCAHTSSVSGVTHWDPRESLFYKRKSYEAEKEVRAIIDHSISIDHFLQPFLIEEGIEKEPFHTPKPKAGESGVRIYADYSPDIDLNYSVLLTREMTESFMKFIDQKFGAFFKQSLLDGTIPEKGLYVYFDINSIHEIVLHPNMNKASDSFREVWAMIEAQGLSDKVTESNLYSKPW